MAAQSGGRRKEDGGGSSGHAVQQLNDAASQPAHTQPAPLVSSSPVIALSPSSLPSSQLKDTGQQLQQQEHKSNDEQSELAVSLPLPPRQTRQQSSSSRSSQLTQPQHPNAVDSPSSHTKSDHREPQPRPFPPSQTQSMRHQAAAGGRVHPVHSDPLSFPFDPADETEEEDGDEADDAAAGGDADDGVEDDDDDDEDDSSPDDSPRENRVLTFADEHQQQLCITYVYDTQQAQYALQHSPLHSAAAGAGGGRLTAGVKGGRDGGGDVAGGGGVERRKERDKAGRRGAGGATSPSAASCQCVVS